MGGEEAGEGEAGYGAEGGRDESSIDIVGDTGAADACKNGINGDCGKGSGESGRTKIVPKLPKINNFHNANP